MVPYLRLSPILRPNAEGRPWPNETALMKNIVQHLGRGSAWKLQPCMQTCLCACVYTNKCAARACEQINQRMQDVRTYACQFVGSGYAEPLVLMQRNPLPLSKISTIDTLALMLPNKWPLWLSLISRARALRLSRCLAVSLSLSLSISAQLVVTMHLMLLRPIKLKSSRFKSNYGPFLVVKICDSFANVATIVDSCPKTIFSTDSRNIFDRHLATFGTHRGFLGKSQKGGTAAAFPLPPRTAPSPQPVCSYPACRLWHSPSRAMWSLPFVR